MAKKRRNKKDKIISQLRRKVKQQSQTFTGKTKTSSTQVILTKPEKNKKKTNPIQKQIQNQNPNQALKKDLIKTLVFSLIALLLLFLLRFWLN